MMATATFAQTLVGLGLQLGQAGGLPTNIADTMVQGDTRYELVVHDADQSESGCSTNGSGCTSNSGCNSDGSC